MRRSFLLITAAALLVTGCSSDAQPADTDRPDVELTGDALDGDVTVFAAASLTDTFTEIGAQFEAANPGVGVTFSFAGSSDLVTQIIEGAPADVFASADTSTMDEVVDAGLGADPTDVATNVLQIVTPPDNPAGVGSFADLADPGLNLVVCAEQVPCGAATKTVADATGVTLSPVSEEQSVTDVLGKITSGQADAGLVYVTDVNSAGDAVAGVTFAESAEAVNRYPIVALDDAANPDAAAAFVSFVAGEQGRRVLADAGFGAP